MVGMAGDCRQRTRLAELAHSLMCDLPSAFLAARQTAQHATQQLAAQLVGHAAGRGLDHALHQAIALAAARAAGLVGVRHLVHNIFQKVEGLIRLRCALPVVSAFTYKWYGATRFPPLLRVCSTEQATMSCMNNSSALATLVVRTYK